MKQSKLASALSMCRRAGKLVCGTQAVQDAALQGKVVQILLCSDTAERTERQVRFACKKIRHLNITRINASMDELAPVLGKQFGVVGICDKQFSILTQLSEMEGLHI